MSEQRTFASNVSFTLGLMTLIADVVPVRRTNSSKKTSLVQVCPDCETKPTQLYSCPEHGTFLPAELRKGRLLEDGNIRVLTDDEIEDVRTFEISQGALALNVCPAVELEAATRPADAAYRIRLGKKSKAHEGAYALLRALVDDPTVALYGLCQLNGRTAPTPFRLVVWRRKPNDPGQLVMQSLIRPADIAESDEVGGEAPEQLVTMGRDLVGKLSAPFDADLLTDERVAKLEKLTEQAAFWAAPVGETAQAPAGDLEALLAASLSAA